MIWTKWSTQTRIVVASVAATLLVAAGIVLFFVWQKDDGNTDAINKAVTTAEEKTNVGDYAQALDTLKQAQSQATTTEQKIQILTNLAAAAANAGQLSEALNYYDQKHQLDPGSTASDGYLVGELYERLGETQKAIEQFELYLGYIKDNPTEEQADARISSMEARIEQLKASQ